ncbi:HpcH/HpaI aldolase/citrate lyase family protein [Colwellia sp. MEBiC06753]
MANLLRSLLFVPGSKPERFAKADAAGSDLICIDLEDAVLPADKDIARTAAIDYIEQHNASICVRLNPLDKPLGQQDLAALSKTPPKYLMLAKAEQPAHIAQIHQACPKTNIIALIESITGLENAYEIASQPNVAALMFGGADMSAELGCEFSYEPLLFCRSQLVIAAAKAKVALLDVPYIDINNQQGLIAETEKIKALGFSGKAAIHPCQIADIHQAFMPEQAQIQYAQQVLAAVDSPDAGVVVVNGRMVDRPIILACQRIIALAQANQS